MLRRLPDQKGRASVFTFATGLCSPEEKTTDAMLRFQPLSYIRKPQIASDYFRCPHGAQSTAVAGAFQHALLPLLAFQTSARLHMKCFTADLQSVSIICTT